MLPSAFERLMIRERTRAALDGGTRIGRPTKLSHQRQEVLMSKIVSLMALLQPEAAL
jgi:hypothetical protein